MLPGIISLPGLIRSFGETIISSATGTKIGNMTAGGGLAAIFDDATSQAQASCGQVSVSNSGYNNTCGKDWGAGVTKTISRFVLYAPNDNNILGSAGGTTVKLQGSQDNSTWTDLYTSGTIGTTGSVTDVNSGITTTTAYRYHRINGNGNGTNTFAIAEIVFYEQ